MLEEFMTLVSTVNTLDDKVFENVKNSLMDAINMTDDQIANIIMNALAAMRDDNYSPSEYTDEINKVRDEFDKLRAVTDTLSPAKKEFTLALVDRFSGIMEAVVDSIDYYHVHLQVERCNPNAVIPTYAHPWDAGADIYAVQEDEILPGQTKIIPTGLKINIPKGWVLSVRPRSGLSAKTPLRIANAPGTIDTGYLSEIGVIVTNASAATSYTIHIGDKIAQFVVEKRWMAAFDEVDNVLDSAEVNRTNSKGEDGYGSTDA